MAILLALKVSEHDLKEKKNVEVLPDNATSPQWPTSTTGWPESKMSRPRLGGVGYCARHGHRAHREASRGKG